MTTSHTPGPWFCTKAKHGIDGGHYAIAVIGDDRDDRALVIHAAAGDDRQAESNAQLFLAAPDLLEALHAAYSDIQRLPGHTIDMLGRIEAAIAKAKGEQA